MRTRKQLTRKQLTVDESLDNPIINLVTWLSGGMTQPPQIFKIPCYFRCSQGIRSRFGPGRRVGKDGRRVSTSARRAFRLLPTLSHVSGVGQRGQRRSSACASRRHPGRLCPPYRFRNWHEEHEKPTKTKNKKFPCYFPCSEGIRVCRSSDDWRWGVSMPPYDMRDTITVSWR